MCMTLYIATSKPMPTISYNEANPCLNTQDIAENETSLISVFTKPHLKYVGSDQGCGCGFRHALLDENNWLRVQDETEDIIDNDNHQNLVDFIAGNNKGEASIEIFSCWDGDHTELIRHFQAIGINEILNKNFYFKERALYTVQL